MGFSFVHAADLHLDTPFKGIGEVAPRVASALRDASLTAFDHLVGLCLDRGAALLVIAGDVYDGAERGIRAQLRFRDGLARLSEAGVHSFVVHGNHDPVGGWSAVNTWPPLVTVFGADSVGSVEVRRDGEPLAVVHGISYGRRDVRENLSLRFRRAAGAGFQIGVLHCNVTGAAKGYDDYSPCSLADLFASGLDYWALGHIHSSMVLSGRLYADEPWVVYPGNIQARSPKPSERGAKGAVVVEVDEGRVRSFEPVACDVVRFADAELDVTGYSDLDEVRSGLLDLVTEQLEAADGRSVVLRGRIAGRSEVHRALSCRGALDELVAEARRELGGGEPFCWLDRLEDSSAAPLDLELVRSGNDFAGDLVRLADDLAQSPGEASQLLAELAASLPKGLAARLSALVEAEPSAEAILRPALSLALDELGVET